MILITDNFFGEELFKAIQDYCEKNEFSIQKSGDKEFSILQTPDELIPLLQIEGYSLILTFIREAHSGFDNDLRIHADNIIQGEKSAIASVTYLNPVEGVTTNGTAFYEHIKYGYKLPSNISNEEFDYLLENDSNKFDKWNRKDIIYSRPNRRVVYDSNYFHSKFPKEITDGKRIVLVCFYKKS